MVNKYNSFDNSNTTFESIEQAQADIIRGINWARKNGCNNRVFITYNGLNWYVYDTDTKELVNTIKISII